MKHITALCCLLVPLTAAAADPDSFTPLFDGTTLSGWEGSPEMFRIQDGAIVAGTLERRIPQNEFLCTTRAYADFELRLKAKLVGEGKNAGIQVRSERIPDDHEVKGYQCDMGVHDGQSVWGALYDESRRRKFLQIGDQKALAKAVRDDDWNLLVIRCEGRRIQIWVNDTKTVDYVESDPDIPQTGIIGLQIHVGPPAEAWYQDIRIKEL